MSDLPSQLQSALRAHTLPTPSRPWLRAVIPNRIPPPPLASLIATARMRILASDLTIPGLLDPSYSAEHHIPSHLVNNPEIDVGRLPCDVVVQVLDIENLSRSRWEQVEELEAVERGEMTRGREVIRVVADEEGEDGEGERPERAGNVEAKATHKVVLQDCRGEKVMGIELKRVEQIGIGKTYIGEKWLLRRDAKISRGVIMLEPAFCQVLGGRVEMWHKGWLEGRLARLKEAAGVVDRR
ncbi:putative mediated genome instability protein rmi1 protein [Podospora aff. communis PSN243]|uniref:Mediated genome instability protein rmi1 protein n=1 Tax=Podospora aff. communis PSN243 TaxID=3040156 RepID=A0AAV9G9D5_9PEZI|nr:putative mediated genome instability protein rmi1 protein [Podospora aff. communis PSN243]